MESLRERKRVGRIRVDYMRERLKVEGAYRGGAAKVPEGQTSCKGCIQFLIVVALCWGWVEGLVMQQSCVEQGSLPRTLGPDENDLLQDTL